MPTSTVKVLFLGEAGSALRATGQLDKSLGGLGRTAGRVGTVLGVGIVGGFVAATKAAVTFDRSMRSVNTLTKLNEREFARLSKQVLALAKETGKAPQDLAKGLYDVVSSGFKANDAIKVLRVSAKAATAGLTDTATATKAINAALNAYHLEADDARKVSDVLFKVVEKGVLTFEDLAQQMGDLVPAAAPLGISLEEVGAAMSTITLQGVPAAEAATRVKNTMLQLASPSKALSALLKENGFESGEAAVKARGFVGVLGLLQEATKGSVTEAAKLTPEIRSLLGVVGLTGKNLDTYLAHLRDMHRAQLGAGASANAFAEQGKSIGVQWDKARAALTAAAIPLGEELFPLLEAGAGKVQDFAAALPGLQAQLGPLVSAAGDLANVSFELARTDAGQFGLLTALSTLGAAKVVGGIRGLALGLGAVSGGTALLVGGLGLLGGALLFAATRSDRLSDALRDLHAAQKGAAEANADAERSAKRVIAADNGLEAAKLALAQATRTAAQVQAQFGKGSIEAKIALNNVKLAQDSVTASQWELNDSRKDARAKGQAATQSEKNLADQHRKTAEAAQHNASAAFHLATQFGTVHDVAKLTIVKEWGEQVEKSLRRAGASKEFAERARAAVASLTRELGRLPTIKEVKIYVRTIVSRSASAGIVPGVGRASGGFVPMTAGAVRGKDSVGIVATPGEIVLNRRQQDVLGGPRYLADLFGFTGAEGPAFAAGGIVPPGAGRGGQPPHRPRRGRPYARTSKAARAALAAVERVNQTQTNLDRAYGQLSREYGISEEVFVLTSTGPGGDEIETLDQAAVAKHVGEIDSLIAHRQRMLALLDAERARLAEAIEVLRRAIEALLQAMRDEEHAAQADAERVRALTRQLRDSERAEDRLRAQDEPKTASGRKARDKELAGFDREQDSLRRQIERGETSRRAHLDKRSSLASQADDFRQAVGVARGALANEVSFDRRDVELDIMELRRQRSDVLAIRARPPAAPLPPFGDSGGGAGIIGGLGDSGELDALRAQIEELTRQLGLARLGIAVEREQLSVLGSFQRGTLHVPVTGPYELHAGERVVPAGIGGWSSGTQNVNVAVDVVLEPDMDGLERFVKVKMVRHRAELGAAMGRDADQRARAGRY